MVLLAVPVLALAGCAGGEKAGPAPSGSPAPGAVADPCASADLTADVPQECVPGGSDPDALPTPSGPPPAEGSAFYDAVVIDDQPGVLQGAGNDQDVARTTSSFSVTVQPGMRIASRSVCEGRTNVVIETVPDSGAATTFSCGFTGAPAEFAVEDSVPVTTPTTFRVTVTVPAPARWYTTIYQNGEAIDPAEQLPQ